MKKAAVFAALAALAVTSFAQEADIPDTNVSLDIPDEIVVEQEAPKREFAQWPAFFAIGEFPVTPDLVGLRLTIPFSTKQESVTGFDIGLWGRSQYFEGVQLNLLRNDVKDGGAGLQLGLYNTIGEAELFAFQVGIWNEAGFISGAQVGLVNLAGDVSGFQVGLINRAEEMYGIQVGLINVIRDAEVQFCPIANIGF